MDGHRSALHRAGRQAADELALGEHVEDAAPGSARASCRRGSAPCRTSTGSRSSSPRAAASSSTRSDSITSGSRNCVPADATMASTATVARTGRDSGRRIRQKNPNDPQPSIDAASSSSVGMLRKNGRRMTIVSGRPKAASGRAIPSGLSSSPRSRTRMNSGQDRDGGREQQAEREQRVQRPRGREMSGGRRRRPPGPRTATTRRSTWPRRSTLLASCRQKLGERQHVRVVRRHPRVRQADRVARELGRCP